MKNMSLLLPIAALTLLLPLTANAKAPGLSPVQVGLGVGWSSSFNNLSTNYYGESEVQGPHFMLEAKFRVAPSFMLGVDASLAIQPWSYGCSYNDLYCDSLSTLFFSGDATLTWYPIRLGYVMVGAGVTGLNLSYEAGYGSGGGHRDSLGEDTEFGWNGMIALGVNIPLSP
ncbi:MAG: hypothetical protein LBM75_03065, partial [Myxococcales bacterium]|nr:hypothetical protein [Myxococcales bacterium]